MFLVTFSQPVVEVWLRERQRKLFLRFVRQTRLSRKPSDTVGFPVCRSVDGCREGSLHCNMNVTVRRWRVRRPQIRWQEAELMNSKKMLNYNYLCLCCSRSDFSDDELLYLNVPERCHCVTRVSLSVICVVLMMVNTNMSHLKQTGWGNVRWQVPLCSAVLSVRWLLC